MFRITKDQEDKFGALNPEFFVCQEQFKIRKWKNSEELRLELKIEHGAQIPVSKMV